jgi:hypothetical protein
MQEIVYTIDNYIYMKETIYILLGLNMIAQIQIIILANMIVRIARDA